MLDPHAWIVIVLAVAGLAAFLARGDLDRAEQRRRRRAARRAHEAIDRMTRGR